MNGILIACSPLVAPISCMGLRKASHAMLVRSSTEEGSAAAPASEKRAQGTNGDPEISADGPSPRSSTDFFARIAKMAPQKLRKAVGQLVGSPIPRYLRASKYLFIHIPKNGGVSISQAIYGRQVWHRTASYFQECDPDFFSSRLSFAVVRNPWDRLVSAYEFCRNGGTVLSRLDMVPPLPLLATFSSFVLDYVVPNKNRLNALDEVLWEQHIFVDDRHGRCLVNHIGRFEDLAGFEAFLLRVKALRSPLAHLNESPGRAHKDYRKYYDSPELVDAVAACYARDVARYSYQFD